MGLLAALFLVLLALKLAHVVSWAWWVVALPLLPESLVDVVVGTALVNGALGQREAERARRERIRGVR